MSTDVGAVPMFDIGWTEIAIITVVALVVIGPKDLPGVVRSIGRWTGKARKVTRDFQRNFETMAEETELAEVRREIAEANRELTQAGRITPDDIGAEDAPSTAADKPQPAAGGSMPPESGSPKSDLSEPEPTGPSSAAAAPASVDAEDKDGPPKA